MKSIELALKRTLLLVTAIALITFMGCHKKTEHPAVGVTGFTPAQGPVGTAVTINGNNFSTTAASNVVNFNGTTATVTSATATSLVATVPQGATTGKISVTVGDNTGVSGSDFTVLVPPAISSFSPASGVVGTTVTITGTNFDATPANNTVKFSGTVASVTQASATSLTVTVPAGAATGKITVTINGLTATSANDFTVPQSPSITSFAPANGAVGTTVTITGTNFDATPGNNTVKFNGTATTVTAATATTLTVTVPTGATTGKITVTTNTLTATSTADFLVPAIITSFASSFTPNTAGVAGTTVTITGTNFDATAANNTVKFNGTATVVSAATTTSLTVTVPQGATSGKITVTVGGVTATSASDFTVFQTPTIASFTPTSAAVGATVTISGSNFDPTAANNTVKFNGTTATVTQAAADGTSLMVTVPTGATTGKISVTAHTLSVSTANDFTITPTVTFSTTTGAIGKLITITAPAGSTFNATPANNTVKFAGVSAPVLTASISQLTVYVPYGATTGNVTVNSNGIDFIPQSFTIISAWTKKMDLPNAAESGGAFAIGNSGYYVPQLDLIGGQVHSGSVYKYVPSTDTWNTQNQTQANPSGLFTITGTVYSMDGANNILYTYNSQSDSWQSSNVNSPIGGSQQVLGIGTKAYAICPTCGSYVFDPSNGGSWTQLSANYDYPGQVANLANVQSFEINGEGYYGGGTVNPNFLNTFYKLNPTSGWTSLANVPDQAVGLMFSNGSYGYCITLNSTNQKYSFWRYVPSANVWIQLEDNSSLYSNIFQSGTAISFTVNNKTYVTGWSTSEFWEYDPSK